MNTHTPTPWKWEGSVYKHMAAEIVGTRGIAQVWEGPNAIADAALIVKAVNHHAEAVAAMEAVVAAFDGRVHSRDALAAVDRCRALLSRIGEERT